MMMYARSKEHDNLTNFIGSYSVQLLLNTRKFVGNLCLIHVLDCSKGFHRNLLLLLTAVCAAFLRFEYTAKDCR